MGWAPECSIPLSSEGDFLSPEAPISKPGALVTTTEMTAIANNPVIEFLADTRPEKVFALTLNPRLVSEETEGEVAQIEVRVASADIITRPTDTPSSTPFYDGLIQPLSFRRSIMTGDGFGGLIRASGEATIDNTRGDFDYLMPLYTMDGTEVELRYGRRADPYNFYYQMMRGFAGVHNVGRRVLRVPISDLSRRLDMPISDVSYAGTGGVEGGKDLLGKRKPIALGWCENVTPTTLDESLLLYQVHNGQVEDISAVYANGLPLTYDTDYADSAALVSASVSSGQYATCLAEGMFKIGNRDDELITADVQGANDGGFSSTVGEIVRRIAIMAGVSSFDELAFAAFEVDHGYEAGRYFAHGHTVTFAEAMSLVAGFGVYFGHRRDGLFTIGLMKAAGSPSLRIKTIDILDDGGVDREPLPDALNPAPWIWRVPWGRNNTVQNGPSVAGAVSSARKTWLAEEERLAVAENPARKAHDPFPRDRSPVHGSLRNEADALAYAQHLLALYGVTRSLYRVPIDQRGFGLDLNKSIRVTHNRIDLTEGRTLSIVDIDEDARTGRVQIIGFG